jgi:uncharacterized integral membrane protein (TIGR00698 family)
LTASDSDAPHSDPRADNRVKNGGLLLRENRLGIILALFGLPPLIYYGNPAVALLVGGALVLVLNQQLFTWGATLSRYCLQTAIVLLGFRLSLQTLWELSADYTWSVAAYVLITLGVGLSLGWLLRVDGASSKLITAGTAICGGTAIATLSTLVRAQPQQTAVALAIVFLLNAVALFSFPLVGEFFDLSQLQFGLWSALAIHDTSSVVATAAIYGDEAAEVATTIKLGRTLWIIPVALGVSLLQRGGDTRLRVPGFVLLFVAAAGFGSVVSLPQAATHAAGLASKALLVCALFLVGTELSRQTVARIRGKVLWQALLLWSLVVPATLTTIVVLG